MEFNRVFATAVKKLIANLIIPYSQWRRKNGKKSNKKRHGAKSRK